MSTPALKKQATTDLSTLQNLPVAAALFDNQKVYFINTKAAKLFKFPASIATSPDKINMFALLDGSIHKKLKINNDQMLKGKKFPPAELNFKDYKGNSLYLEIISNTVWYNGKKVIQSTFTEITKRKKTELLLKETKERFEFLTNNTNDIICFYTYLDPEKYIFVSPNIQRILGYKPEELLANYNFFNDRVIGDPTGFIRIDAKLKRFQRRNIRKDVHYTFKTFKKNKEEVWLENLLTPIVDDKGKIRFYLNIIRDITTQKEKELELQAQYLNYQNLLDNSQVAYVIHSRGKIVYCNKEFLKTLKLKGNKQALEKPIEAIFAPEDKKRVTGRIKEVYKMHKIGQPGVYRLLDSEGSKVEVEIRSSLINYNNSPCILSSIINVSKERQQERDRLRAELSEQNNKALQKEILERQETEKKLIERSGRLKSILENTSHLVWTLNREKQILSFNQNFANTLLEKYKIRLKEGLRVDRAMKKNRQAYIDYWYPRYERSFRGEKLEFEREEFEKGKPVYRKIFINPIFDDQGKVTEVSCIAHDITDAKIYEHKLKAQSAKLNAIFESSRHYIWTIDEKKKLTSFNKNYFDFIANICNTKPYIGLVLPSGILSADGALNESLKQHYAKAFAGRSTNFEIETVDNNHNPIYLDIFLNPILENNRVAEVSGIAHDITEKKTDQHKIEQSLKEKEVLLKEVHHRVKNNMQVISSILNLQSSYVSDEYTLSLLKESQNRITTMAYIHESLYQNKSFTSVNFSDYVKTLANNIIQSYSIGGEKVLLVLNLQKIHLSLDHSIPSGLIINELITNAIKHAFKGMAKGIITINLKSENNSVYLEVKDNGVGVAPSIDIKNTNSLGLQLVNTLVDQIEGKMEFISQKGKGTSVSVTFKM